MQISESWEHRKQGVQLAVAGGVLLVAYLLTAAILGRSVPSGTSVDGVDIGGLASWGQGQARRSR